MKPLISYDDFAKLDIRVGHVMNCERKEGADKLLRLTVDFGEKEGTRNILSSIYPHYEPKEMKDKNFIFLLNLEPRKFMGEASEGMILCADAEKPIPLIPHEDVPTGTIIT